MCSSFLCFGFLLFGVEVGGGDAELASAALALGCMVFTDIDKTVAGRSNTF